MLRRKVQKQREQLRTLAARRKELAREVIMAQEEERHRVWRELHDEVGQALTALKVSLEMLEADLSAFALKREASRLVQERLSGARSLVESTMAQMRTLAHDLRPAALDDLGLNLTLEGYCRDFVERTRLRIDYAGQELPPLSGAAEICLYRFLQEALTNVARHADAQEVVVGLCCQDDKVSLMVEDDGRGFNAHMSVAAHSQAKGIGLLGMQERLESLGGRLEIETSPGEGARLTAVVPRRRARA